MNSIAFLSTERQVEVPSVNKLYTLYTLFTINLINLLKKTIIKLFSALIYFYIDSKAVNEKSNKNMCAITVKKLKGQKNSKSKLNILNYKTCLGFVWQGFCRRGAYSAGISEKLQKFPL